MQQSGDKMSSFRGRFRSTDRPLEVIVEESLTALDEAPIVLENRSVSALSVLVILIVVVHQLFYELDNGII